MVGIIIKVVIGLALFAGSLVGGLAATGRLNHEGTANIPVLNSFFPEPPAAEGEGGEGGGEAGHGNTGEAAAAHPAPGGETNAAEGAHSGDKGEATEASHNPQNPSSSRSVIGPSHLNPEVPKSDGHGGHGDDGHGGGGHGDDAAHGEDTSHGAPAGNHGAGAHANTGHGSHGDSHGKTKAEEDFDKMTSALRSQGRISYEPGAFFTFDGMPAGMTPEQINEAWQRVQGVLQTIEQRETALDLREAQLKELGDDISKRWKDISKERARIEQMHSELKAKIAKFEQTVKLVRNDEVQKLKNNAATLASFERKKASELVQQQWATERGQDEILRVLEFMDKDAVNEILAELPNAMVQDVLEKRMQISKEPKSSDGRD